MARVKIKFPGHSPLFEVRIPVRINDINYGGHLGNDSLLSILHEARLQMLVANGLSELEAGGHGLIMAEVVIAYKGEAFHGDVLAVRIYSENISRYSFDLLYEVTTVREGQRIQVAEARTGMVCFDYRPRKVCEMSHRLKTVLRTEASQ